MIEPRIYPKVTFTMTAGRRLPLFQRTMRSFMKHCLDTEMIQEWLVCDDRSSTQDLAVMKNEFPFLTIFHADNIGQAAALNALWSRVKTPFICHWEDDWDVVNEGHFIREMIDIAESNPHVRNVTLRGWRGPYVKEMNGVEYYVHVHDQSVPAAMVERADAFWYGYSLNPGLQCKSMLDRLGAYNECDLTRFFDRPHAEKYLAWNFWRANTTTEYVRHIGDCNGAYELPI